MHTFLWHDYETFGVNARSARPAQFAAIRTDADLNQLGQPMMFYCQPANDFLPDPVACLITGITPQQCLAQGLPEYRFASQIEHALAQPGTIGAGYNSIRFDDEITRFMFWRNLIDPYAREWQNDCGRWDILDLARAAYALRPDGVVWPVDDAGKPSFKLADLSAANGLLHSAAHDALSDVAATIALARLLKAAQPRLFDFCFALHKKDRVSRELGLPTTSEQARPFWHVSGMFAPERGCLALMWPLAMHPDNKNELLAWDLAKDPSALPDLNAEQIRQRLFCKSADLPAGVQRLPIKSIHINKSPVAVANLQVLSSAQSQRFGIDVAMQLEHAAKARQLPDMSAIWPAVFRREEAAAPDVDEALYAGFIGTADRRRLEQCRHSKPQQLTGAQPRFDDCRLAELLLRYRARNFPASLSEAEQKQWQAHRVARLVEGAAGALSLSDLVAIIDDLRQGVDQRGQEILTALLDYAHSIAPSRS